MNLEKLKSTFKLSLLFLAISAFGCGTPEPPKSEVVTNFPETSTSPDIPDEKARKLIKYKAAIEPFFDRMQIRKGDWLQSFSEPGQTFEEYISQEPTLPTESRKKIYIQPIGEFTNAQKKAIQLTSEFMRDFYNLPVVLFDTKPFGKIPKEMMRINPLDGQTQIKTTYFLDETLPKMLPEDAAALICFTNSDLFPNESFNYVFGVASLDRRVGVWSLWRFGNPEKGKKNYDLFLARTLKVGMHETGHMFSIRHCTKYECLMSGSNHLDESDRRPLDVCPECALKIAWAMNYDLGERYEKLAFFCERVGWDETKATFLKKAKAVKLVNIQ